MLTSTGRRRWQRACWRRGGPGLLEGFCSWGFRRRRVVVRALRHGWSPGHAVGKQPWFSRWRTSPGRRRQPDGDRSDLVAPPACPDRAVVAVEATDPAQRSRAGECSAPFARFDGNRGACRADRLVAADGRDGGAAAAPAVSRSRPASLSVSDGDGSAGWRRRPVVLGPMAAPGLRCTRRRWPARLWLRRRGGRGPGSHAGCRPSGWRVGAGRRSGPCSGL